MVSLALALVLISAPAEPIAADVASEIVKEIGVPKGDTDVITILLINLKKEYDTAPLVVGLTKDPDSLVQVRKNRLRMISEREDETDYVDIDAVREEVSAARRLCGQQGWPLIDVTRRSIEETAATILAHYARHGQGTVES